MMDKNWSRITAYVYVLIAVFILALCKYLAGFN
jgi:hypothetical protein